MKDKRDLRDPKILGEVLLANRRKGSRPMAAHYDLGKWKVPDYTGFLSGYYTAKEYLAELEERTDIYAKSTLDAIRTGKKNPNAEIV